MKIPSQLKEKSFEVVVVGAGLTGLTAASLLAQQKQQLENEGYNILKSLLF